MTIAAVAGVANCQSNAVHRAFQMPAQSRFRWKSALYATNEVPVQSTSLYKPDNNCND